MLPIVVPLTSISPVLSPVLVATMPDDAPVRIVSPGLSSVPVPVAVEVTSSATPSWPVLLVPPSAPAPPLQLSRRRTLRFSRCKHRSFLQNTTMSESLFRQFGLLLGVSCRLDFRLFNFQFSRFGILIFVLF